MRNIRRPPTRPLVHIRKIREAWPLLSARGRVQTLNRLSDLLEDLRREMDFEETGAKPTTSSSFGIGPIADYTVQMRYRQNHSTNSELVE